MNSNNNDSVLSHVDAEGKAKIVDISVKRETLRTAEAHGYIMASAEIIKKIRENEIKKGDVFTVSKLAGILAAKKTHDLIPLCHQIKITSVDISFKISDDENKITAISVVTGFDRTGVEMEALLSVSIALLNIYDMCKALCKEMIIGGVELLKKSGGKSEYKKM
jgi:cyclic pyranopterin phosphate synthase